MIATDVTFGVSCTGNIQALLLCLSTVIMGDVVPARITVRMEGEFPSTTNFYLEQLMALAVIIGSQITITYAKSNGIRNARDWHLQDCRTDFLWMGDDDVLYAHHCLQNYLWAVMTLRGHNLRDEHGRTGCIGYVNGSKPDVNNRRGYGDFSTACLTADAQLANGASMNQFYQIADGQPVLVRTKTMDTGNVLLYVKNLRAQNIWFNKFGTHYNSGGEDTLMGLHCNNEQCYGFFCPSAKSVHLEKPVTNFGEFAARGELLLRSCERLNISTEDLGKEFMPFIQPST